MPNEKKILESLNIDKNPKPFDKFQTQKSFNPCGGFHLSTSLNNINVCLLTTMAYSCMI